MLGWSLSIYRLADYNRVRPPEVFSLCLASWKAGPAGIDWLDPLVEAGTAAREGNGYPFLYLAKAGAILPLLAGGPPSNEGPAVIGEDYALPSGWVGRGKFNQALIEQCSPAEDLMIQVFDQS